MATIDIGLFKLRSVYIPDNSYNSFFYLNRNDVPTSFASSGVDIVPLKLRYGKEFDKTFYSSLGTFTTQTSQGVIGASPIIFQRLGLAENEDVFVSFTKSNPVTVISVRPTSSDDFNILANIPNIMENIMLNQVRIVSSKQQMTLKIGNILIDLVVENMKPLTDCGRLEQYTEVVVLDTFYANDEDHRLANFSNYLTLNDLVWKVYKWGSDLFHQTLLSSNNIEVVRETIKSPKDKLAAAFNEKRKKCHYYRVVLELNRNDSENVINTNYGFKSTSSTPCRVTKVPEITVINGAASKIPTNSFECYIQQIPSSSSIPQIYMTASLMKHLNLNIGSRVVIEEIPILKDTKSILNGHIREPEQTKETFISWQSLTANLLQVNKSIESWIKCKMNNNILIVGPAGCGKTSLLKMIAKHSEFKNIYCSSIDCKSLRGKKIESLSKILLGKWSECAHRDPSILILDDLDSLMYLNEEEGDGGMSTAYCKRVADLISKLYKSFEINSQILLVATSSSVSNLGPSLATSRGPRLFNLVVTITELTAEERLEVLKFLNVDVTFDFVNQTNGFRIQDLHDLMSRAKLQSIMDGRTSVSEVDLQTALSETVPMSLKGVKLQTDVPYKWSDVGGMDQVKSVLNEIFRWPSMHPEIFSTCPLKMQTGALLYGPPGCGKTLIAGALANECGMNFKSVKGPELLSKYIGASEAAVRDLFEKAQQARPCLIFFDELDSLAPRRGADSTGVTDRVVNQLLTELDGVEGCSGVWVLGASSRPDLIDPALLRPGRLDRAVYCPVPSQDERLRILEVLSKTLSLAEDVVFNNVIHKTEGFTGADLQAVLYNAQMKSIQDNQECIEDAKFIVTAKHLEDAIIESKSSLSEKERKKYEQISKRFQGLGAKDLQKTFMTNEQQRVTLA